MMMAVDHVVEGEVVVIEGEVAVGVEVVEGALRLGAMHLIKHK
jgi:hypothetical protein